MDTLNKGTKELLSVILTDRLGLIDTIPAADFKVISEDETTIVQDWVAADSISGLRVDCLVDTSTWDEGTYKLFVRPDIPPESPIIGPFEFGVS